MTIGELKESIINISNDTVVFVRGGGSYDEGVSLEAEALDYGYTRPSGYRWFYYGTDKRYKTKAVLIRGYE